MAGVTLQAARVLVLGGSGVIGSAIAHELVQRGALVMLSGRDADRLASRAASIGDRTGVVRGDLADDDGPADIVNAAVEFFGGLDGIVNAAGTVAFGPVIDLEDDVLNELIASNLVGPIRAIRHAIGHMDGGFVVSISGVVAEAPVAGMAAYSGAKAGLSAITSALTRELRRDGVHVLDARPPHTETGLAARPLAGTAPPLPPGLDPARVASIIVDGLGVGRRELAAADFA